MDSNTKKVQEAIPSRFKLGDLVLAKIKSSMCMFEIEKDWLSVICPDFGSNDEYAKVALLSGDRSARHYHVQHLGSRFEKAWVPESELNIIRRDDVQYKSILRSFDKKALKYFKKYAKKTSEEMVEICRVRAETFDSFKYSDINNGRLKSVVEKEICDVKSENIDLKFQLKSLKESFADLKNFVISQNNDQPQNEQETESNNENAKKNKLDKVENYAELKKINKDLKKDNLKLSNENTRLSKENEDYEKMQKQNEAMIKSLKQDLLKLSQENVHLKYGQGSKNGPF